MRKRTNALGRLYQRTKNNYLRESRRDQYTTAKTPYQAAIKNGKTIPWKKILHCNITDESMEWDIQNRLGKNTTEGNYDNTTKT